MIIFLIFIFIFFNFFLVGCVVYMSKDSFQYGFRVFRITEVVCVCSPSTVTTANGSGNPTSSPKLSIAGGGGGQVEGVGSEWCSSAGGAGGGVSLKMSRL